MFANQPLSLVISLIIGVYFINPTWGYYYENVYVTNCNDEEECGTVDNCGWVSNGIATREGMFDSYCTCSSGTQYVCTYELGGQSYYANECSGKEKPPCDIQCGLEVCIQTEEGFMKTGKIVSACPHYHPVNNAQCCAASDEKSRAAYCTCLTQNTIDVSFEVYNAIGNKNQFVKVWSGACETENYATSSTKVVLTNKDSISGWSYKLYVNPVSPDISVYWVKAKPSNSDYFVSCNKEYDYYNCGPFDDNKYQYEGPMSIQVGTSYGGYHNLYNILSVDEDGASYTYDVTQSDGKQAFTEDEGSDGNKSPPTTVIAIIIVVLLVILIVIGAVIYVKRRNNKGVVEFKEEYGVDANNNSGDIHRDGQVGNDTPTKPKDEQHVEQDEIEINQTVDTEV
eukprot:CAMPEP_0201570122 /NCGR_PEP_ID=MMETSP0190_2-20130828/12234_1 /ASSEMBLY_ACC=CAM_ASM_000263 /TAXON_ID=37353 /ORGANISM="Rosalina sp." /LENGTH=395 /DNA_ID=CAMNT_0047993309 /DNA_START=106 /DNA_END=1293 /DNA_ORIENTATION=+